MWSYDPGVIFKYTGYLGYQGSILFDHRRDIEAGKAAGCATIAAAYGYLADGESATAWKADAIAYNSLELSQMIENQLQ